MSWYKAGEKKLGQYFLTGIIVAGPLAITIFIASWFVNKVDGTVRSLIPEAYSPESYLPFQIPGYGLIVTFVALTSLGFLTATLLGRALISVWERFFERMPIVRSLYKMVKQLFETVFSKSGTSFRQVVLVPFPTPDMWSIAFVSSDPPKSFSAFMPDGEQEEYVSVFMPCTPNPTTGFFFYLPRRSIIEVPLSIEEAAKLIMSAGLIQPEAVLDSMSVPKKSPQITPTS
jgi:uncharacterized membrane protein